LESPVVALARISVTGDIDDFRVLLAKVGNGVGLSQAEAEREFNKRLQTS
jgi:hypothetical protein